MVRRQYTVVPQSGQKCIETVPSESALRSNTLLFPVWDTMPASAKYAATPNTLPVRNWQAVQLHELTLAGSPFSVIARL